MKRSNLVQKSLLASAITTALSGFNSLAQAQEEQTETPNRLEVVTVSAQKIVQNIQEVPISVTALSGEILEKNGIKDLAEMSALVPNLTIADSAINTNIFMRGVGSGNNRAFEQSVGMFIDGIYMGRDRQYRVPFLDLERAEVLRGPQGILFGKNTIAGTLNLTTARARLGEDFNGSVAFDWEPRYDGRSITGIFATGLTDEFGIRVAAKTGSSDGYMYNSVLDRDEPETTDKLVRVSFNWQPQDDLEFNLKLEQSSFEVVGSTSQVIKLDPLTPTAGFIANMVIPLRDPSFTARKDLVRSTDNQLVNEGRDTDATNAALNIDYTLDSGTLTFVTGLSSYESFEQLDADFGPLPFIGTSDEHDFSQFNQEIRYASNTEGRFQYITGLYYQTSDFNVDFWSHAQIDDISPVLGLAMQSLPAQILDPNISAGLTIWDIGVRPESYGRSSKFRQKSDTYSVFYQGTIDISDDLSMILGGRYSNEDKSALRATKLTQPTETYYDTAAPSGLNGTVTATLMRITVPLPFYDGSRSESNFTPSIKVLYDLNDDIMIYANAERGYKGGGFNSAPDATETNQEFKQEEATGFEVGFKSDLLDGVARLNAALFHTEFDDLQVTTWNGFAFEVGNAAKSVTKGLEIDGQLLFNNNWTLIASMSLLDSTYKSYLTGPCTVVVEAQTGNSQCDLSGRKTPYAADVSGAIFLDYFKEVGEYEVNASLNLNYTDDYYLDTDLDEVLKQDAYTSVNLRISVQPFDQSWELAFVGKNLTDERIITAGADTPLIAGGYAAYTAAPRTVSLQVKLRF